MVSGGGVSIFARGRTPVLFILLIIFGSFLLRRDLKGPQKPALPSQKPGNLEFGRLPIGFEPNQGQSDPRVRFLARGLGYGLYLTQDEAVLALPGDRKSKGSALQMRLQGASSAAQISGLAQLPSRTNYILGNNPARWKHNIAEYSRVRYSEIYPGIDLDFYGRQGRLEYDFNVYPGADPNRIEISFDGAQDLVIGPKGDLELSVDGRQIGFEIPRVYQDSASGANTVAGKFILRGKNRVGFLVGDYDRSRTLVIDPVLSFSTFLGGSGSESCAAITGQPFVAHCPSIAVDSASRVYVAGATTSTSGFPVPTGGSASTLGPGGGGADVFIMRFDTTGTVLDFTTFLGGSGVDYPTGLGVDSGFNVYVAGTTNSGDFPTLNGVPVTVAAGNNHAFLTKLDSSGSVNVYSTLLGGGGTDTTSGLAVDSQSVAYIFGTTSSADFPTTTGALQPAALATNQFFFSKINPSSTGTNSLQYSTFIGGSTPSAGTVSGGAIAVDSTFNVYLAGGTTFTDMPLLNASQGTFGTKTSNGSDVWVARLNAPAANTQLYIADYETYLGGSGDDIAYGVTTDTGANTFVTGSTSSPNITIPTGTTAFQPTLAGGTDAFVAKFGLPPTPTSTTQGAVPFEFFTYLGGSSNDAGLSIVADPTTTTTVGGNVHVTGFTQSANFPVANSPFQGTYGGGASDAFVARILTVSTTSTTNTSSVSFLGGSGSDIGTSVAIDPALVTYVAGETSSANFPLKTPLDGTFSGSSDAFATKLAPNSAGLNFTCIGSGCPSPAPTNPTVNPTPVGVGSNITFTYSIYNTGDPLSGVLFTDNIGQTANSTLVSANVNSGTGGSCAANTSTGTAVCNLGIVNTSTVTVGTTTTVSTAATVTVVVTAKPPTATTGVIPPKPPDVGNSAALSIPGTAFQQTAAGSASVNDFGISTAQATQTQTITAGATASYVLTVTPTGPIPESVSLACGSGLPAGGSCSFSNNSIPNLNNGPQSRTLEIATQPRVTTPASLFGHSGPLYALFLPLSGIALIGSGYSRKRRLLMALFCGFLLTLVAAQMGCSSSSTTTTTTGTPAGTYSVIVNATSGTATRSTTIQLIVK